MCSQLFALNEKFNLENVLTSPNVTGAIHPGRIFVFLFFGASGYVRLNNVVEETEIQFLTEQKVRVGGKNC